MKKKRRLLMLIANLAAAGLAAGSAWLQWWNGAWPANTDMNQLLTSAHVDSTNFLPFSVAMLIFVIAGLMLLSALTAWKLFGFLGVIIGGTTIVLWFMNSSLRIDQGLMNIEVIGRGTLAMVAAIMLTIILMLLPQRKVKES